MVLPLKFENEIGGSKRSTACGTNACLSGTIILLKKNNFQRA